MRLECDSGAAIEGSITQPVPRVLPHDAPLMVVTMGHMGHPHLVTRGRCLLQ